MENITNVGPNFGYLVDVIGILSAASKEKLLIKGNHVYKMMEIDLMDNTGKCHCVLIGDAVQTLSDYLCLNWVLRPVVGLRFVDVRRVEGKFTVQIIPYVSRIYINQVFEHLMFNDGVSVVSGLVISFIKDSPWWYVSCRCHTEVIPEDDVYKCHRCYRNIAKTIRRYRIRLELFDGTDIAMFVLNDAVVSELVGLPCEKLLNFIEDPLVPQYPTLLEEKLLGEEFLFKVRIGGQMSYNGERIYEVLRLCSDADVIAMFNSGIAIITPSKDKFIPPFTELEGVLDGADVENKTVTDLEKIEGDDDSDMAGMNQLEYISDGTNPSVNQPIIRRPLKRKLIQEFDDAVDKYVGVLKAVEVAFQRKLSDKYIFNNLGECSSKPAGLSSLKVLCHSSEGVKSDDYIKKNVITDDEELVMVHKSVIDVGGDTLETMSKVDGVKSSLTPMGNVSYLRKKKSSCIEFVDLTISEDGSKGLPALECNLGEYRFSPMGNVGYLKEQKSSCIEFVDLTKSDHGCNASVSYKCNNNQYADITESFRCEDNFEVLSQPNGQGVDPTEVVDLTL
ncbi:uncharacterized protein LOC130711920 isoform X2 [Lotus japonicus]|uniref:uncharacterized protein LOC130711920 isoform X2 n=1 Tax=Lotus japonicus TaxID=34305 RepID=UPI0025889C75|nr:uncharacterized protein LOC130711920 isoform X2 [Lotus japonicus]XP_057417686.1 uncharacterized protein LOC130711920 isoform X2 [Lotus japonicus]